jgi:hypothetical protein
LDSYSAGSLKQQSTGRYDDDGFVLDKHAELDSYSASSLKQQSTGRYDDGRFVIDNTLSWILCLVQRDHHHIYLWIVASVS